MSDSLRPHGLHSPWNTPGQRVAFPLSRGSSQPRDRTWVFCIAGGFFSSWATREAQNIARYDFNYVQGYRLCSVIKYSHPHIPTPKGLDMETLCFPLNCDSPAPFPPAPNHHSTSCLYQFHSPKYLTEEQLCGTCPFVIGSFHLALLTKINVKHCELRVVRKFYLGQNENYSLGDSISDSSKKLLHSGGGKVSTYVILLKGVCVPWSMCFFVWKVSGSFVRVSASHEEQTSPWRILVLF